MLRGFEGSDWSPDDPQLAWYVTVAVPGVLLRTIFAVLLPSGAKGLLLPGANVALVRFTV
jgi:hypothetical protein